MPFFNVGESSFNKLARQLEEIEQSGQEVGRIKFTPGLFQTNAGLCNDLIDYARSMQALAEKYGTVKGASAKTWALLAAVGEVGLEQVANSVARERGF